MWRTASCSSLVPEVPAPIALDEGYAQPWAGMADAFIQLPLYDAVLPAEAFRQARDAAGRALDLDDRLAEAHTSMAYTDFVYTRRWRAAEDGFRRAMSRNPQYPTAQLVEPRVAGIPDQHQAGVSHGMPAGGRSIGEGPRELFPGNPPAGRQAVQELQIAELDRLGPTGEHRERLDLLLRCGSFGGRLVQAIEGVGRTSVEHRGLRERW